ncbi:NYN domain-containing protein [Pelotomaculum propionicicum]|uniref:NYN domain-containing protein n=1 Tax=Pelotomaculum propionicicum TaxID=258475 RepID=UPI003B7B0217
MKEFLVVDGYNIIFAWPEFEKFKESGLEHARFKMVSILANYSHLSGKKIYLVFDAHQVKNSLERIETIDTVEVIYTQHGVTADALIESLVGKLLNEGTVYVATSDWAEQNIVFGRGAYRLTPGELLLEVKRTRQESERHYVKSVPSDSYLENFLLEKVRSKLERLRRQKK